MYKMNMTLFALITIVCLCASVATAYQISNKSVNASEPTNQSYISLLKLDNSISQLYKLGNASNKQATYQRIQVIKKQLKQPELVQYGSATGWKHMQRDLLALEKAIINKEPGSVWRESISSLRLASDALLQNEHGPWLQYEAVLLDDLQMIRKTVQSTSLSRIEASTALTQIFAKRVSRMEAAAYMVGDEMRMNELIERTLLLDERLASTEAQQWTSVQQQLERELVAIEVTIQALFAQAEATITVPEVDMPGGSMPTMLAFIIGAFVSALLTYTAYRKYKQLPYGIKKV